MATGDLTGGPAQLVLTATVARRYYVDGRSKVEIADELDLSRFKVARLLDLALGTGLVRIEIAHPGEIDVAISSDLRDAYGLQHAVVVDTLEEDGESYASRSARPLPAFSPRSSRPPTSSVWVGRGP